MAGSFERTYKVRATFRAPEATFDDPLAQNGFVAVKITEMHDGVYKESYGDWIKFKHTADELAVTELVARAARELIGRQVARYVAEEAAKPDGA